MLLRFGVRNHRSIRDYQEFSASKRGISVARQGSQISLMRWTRWLRPWRTFTVSGRTENQQDLAEYGLEFTATEVGVAV